MLAPAQIALPMEFLAGTAVTRRCGNVGWWEFGRVLFAVIVSVNVVQVGMSDAGHSIVRPGTGTIGTSCQAARNA
jgi:hypothetical protein